MIALKILRQRSVKSAQPLGFIFHSVRMNDVDDHAQAHPVRSVDQLFELIWRPKSRTHCKKVRHMVAKTAVIGVLLDRHQLDGVIAGFFDAGQDVARKLIERRNLRLFGAHADVRFVNQWHIRGGSCAILPLIWFFRRPHFSCKIMRLGILHDICRIRRDAPTVATLPVDAQFIPLSVLDRPQGKSAVPLSVLGALESKFIPLLPICKIPHENNPCRIWRPLPKYPTLVRSMQSKMPKTERERRQRCARQHLRSFRLDISLTRHDYRLVRS